jgi:hypothetical protein
LLLLALVEKGIAIAVLFLSVFWASVSFMLIRTTLRPLRNTIRFAVGAGVKSANTSHMQRICRNTLVGGVLAAVPFICFMTVLGTGYLWFRDTLLSGPSWLNPLIGGIYWTMISTDMVSEWMLCDLS